MVRGAPDLGRLPNQHLEVLSPIAAHVKIDAVPMPRARSSPATAAPAPSRRQTRPRAAAARKSAWKKTPGNSSASVSQDNPNGFADRARIGAAIDAAPIPSRGLSAPHGERQSGDAQQHHRGRRGFRNRQRFPLHRVRAAGEGEPEGKGGVEARHPVPQRRTRGRFLTCDLHCKGHRIGLACRTKSIGLPPRSRASDWSHLHRAAAGRRRLSLPFAHLPGHGDRGGCD